MKTKEFLSLEGKESRIDVQMTNLPSLTFQKGQTTLQPIDEEHTLLSPVEAPQASPLLKHKNVDEEVEQLRSRGIDVFDVVCHVSNPQQRKNLIEKTLQALASEMAPDTRVNTVAPGFVPTHFADFLTKNEATRLSPSKFVAGRT